MRLLQSLRPGDALAHGGADPELARIYSAVRRLIAELRERQQAQRRALSSERLAAVGRMTAAVAHEINNPLGGLINAVQTLKVHGDSEATRRRSVDLLQRGLQALADQPGVARGSAAAEDQGPLTGGCLPPFEAWPGSGMEG